MRSFSKTTYYLLLAIAPIATSAHAATRTWTNPVSGTFSTSTNWTGGLPGPADTARFSAEASSPYTVTFTSATTSNDTLLYLQDNVIFDLKAHTYSLTDTSSTNQSVQIGSSAGGSLLVKSSTGTGTLSSLYTVIGRAAGGVGSLTLDAGTLWKNADDFLVGSSGTGTLTVQAGADLSATGSLILGSSASSTGSSTFTGAGTTVTSSSTTIGSFGHGSLSLLAGAHLSTSSLLIGYNPNATGSFSLDGAATAATSTGDLTIGEDGNASLSLSNSASLSTTNTFLAITSGTTSSASLSGASSSWSSTGSFYVGGDSTTAGGQATLNLSSGSLSVTNTLKIWNSTNTSLNLSGASLTVGSLDTTSTPSHFNWTNGSLTLTNSSLTLSSTGPLGPSLTLNPGMSLNITGSSKTLTLASGSTLTLNGGTLNAITTYSTGSTLNLASGSFTLPASSFASKFINNGSFTGPASGNTTFAAAVSGTGSYTGNTLFKSSLSPGSSTSSASISLAKTSFASTNTLNLKLGGATAGSQYDQLTFSNPSTLAGTLSVSLLNSFSPSAGQSFNLLDGTTTGTFSTTNLPTISPLRWNTNFLYSNGTLLVRPASESLTWSSAVTGTFSDYTKWSGALAAPDTPDTAVFNNAASSPYTVTLPGSITNDRLLILHDNVNFSMSSNYFLANTSTATPGISIGSSSGASLSLSSLYPSSSLGAYNVAIAPNPGDIGSFTLNSSAYSTTLEANSLFLGGSATAPGGAGTLNIPTQSVTVNGILKIWNTPGTSLNFSGGILSVGALDVSSNLSRLNWTAGTLNITNSNLILNSTGPFGSSLILPTNQTLEISSSSTFTVDASSILSITGGYLDSNFTTLGSSPGTASLSFTAGSFFSDHLYMGYNAGSTGAATVSGASSVWNSSTTIIGYNGAGSLNLSASASASFGTCYLGMNSTGNGSLTLNGPTGIVSASLFVGESGAGSLTVQNGAILKADIILAEQAGSTGTATLTGSSTTWQCNSIYIGGNSSSLGGNGLLNILSGSLTDNGILKIWNTPGSSLNLSGGTLSVGSLDTNSNPANFNWTAGTLNITNSSLSLDLSSPFGLSFTLSTGHTLHLSAPNSTFYNSTGTFNLTGGTLEAPNIDLRTGTTNFSAGTLQIDNGTLNTGSAPTPQTFAGAITGTGSLQKDSTTSLTLTGSLSYTGATFLNQGTLALSTPLTSTANIFLSSTATLRLLPGSSIYTSNLWFITSPMTPTVDLTTTSLTFSPTRYSFATFRSTLAGSYDHGHWDLPGIDSSSAAANPNLYSIGYLENDPANSFTVQFTLVGDLNLDGKLNADDYALLDRSYAKNLPPSWSTGDLNYDGIIDSADYLLIDKSFALQSGPLSPTFLAMRESQFGDAYVQSLLTSLPEPTSPLIFSLLIPTLLSCRYRKHQIG
ncbi:MAG TPA: hypothetical protein VFE58_19075 [Tepidisphaeraceae bacterium]|jgi:T5SS/PEP-CTERM-associated repeat protein/autotransporter-associated beta strand protein|nr:hypothetical protein [Tepidisphaeraceae bacterium]